MINSLRRPNEQPFDAGRSQGKSKSLTLVLKTTIHGSRGDPPRHAD